MAMVYKARVDDGGVAVDWLVCDSLQQLEDALSDGWKTSEADALAGFSPPVDSAEPAEPVDDVTTTKRSTARKKR